MTLTMMAVLAGMLAQVDGPRVELTTIDGQVHTVPLVDLNAERVGLSVAPDGEHVQSIPRPMVQQIQMAGDDAPAEPMSLLDQPGRSVLMTRRGDVLAVEGLAYAQDRLAFRNVLTGAAGCDLGDVAFIVLPPPDRAAQRYLDTIAESDLTGDTNDYLLIQREPGELVPVAGVFTALTGREIGFRFGGEDRSIDVARVPLIRIAPAGAEAEASAGVLIGIDGNRLGFRQITFETGQFRLAGTFAGDLAVPIERVRAIQFRSELVTWLSELEPIEVSQAGTFDHVFDWRRDRSSAGGPIRLQARRYNRGLGLHSQCTLVFPLGGEYATFVADAGIDDATRGKGDAVLVISADTQDEPLARHRLTGQDDQPIELRLDVTDANALTITVEFGEALDVADHVSLGGARLIRPLQTEPDAE